MHRDLKAQLGSLKDAHSPLSPRAEWVQHTRERVLARARQTAAGVESKTRFEQVNTHVRMLLPSRAFLFARSMAVLVLVVGLAVSGWLTGVNAAYNSLPGDFLYGVKLASEKTQKVVAKVTNNNEAAVQLSLESAGRRAAEIKQIAKEKPAEVQKTSERLKKSLSEATEEVQSVKATDPEKAATLAKNITQKTGEIQDNLEDVVDEANPEAADVAKGIVETVKAVDTAAFDAIAVVLETDPTGPEVKAFVEKKSQELIVDAAESVAKVKDIQEQVETTTSSITGVNDAPLATSTDTTTTSSSDTALSEGQESTQTVTPKESIDTAVKTVTEGAEEIEKGVEETKKLVESGQLQEAVNTLKKLSDINKKLTDIKGDAQGVLVEVKKNASETSKEPMTGTPVTPPPTVIPTPTTVPSTTSVDTPADTTTTVPTVSTTTTTTTTVLQPSVASPTATSASPQ